MPAELIDNQLYLPYPESLKVKTKFLEYIIDGKKGSALLDSVEVIFCLGDGINFPSEFLFKCQKKRIPVISYKTHLDEPLFITGSVLRASDNTLLKQIECYKNKKKRLVIVRKILERKFANQCWIGLKKVRLYRVINLENCLEVEGLRSKQYFRCYKKELKKRNVEFKSRRTKSSANLFLNAGYTYIRGIILRWVVFHRLSPHYGFLHKCTRYPALAYDLMELYRCWIDKWFIEYLDRRSSLRDPNNFVRYCSQALNEKIFVAHQSQKISRKEFIKLSVWQLKKYLVGKNKTLVLPEEYFSLRPGRKVKL